MTKPWRWYREVYQNESRAEKPKLNWKKEAEMVLPRAEKVTKEFDGHIPITWVLDRAFMKRLLFLDRCIGIQRSDLK